MTWGIKRFKALGYHLFLHLKDGLHEAGARSLWDRKHGRFVLWALFNVVLLEAFLQIRAVTCNSRHSLRSCWPLALGAALVCRSWAHLALPVLLSNLALPRISAGKTLLLIVPKVCRSPKGILWTNRQGGLLLVFPLT